MPTFKFRAVDSSGTEVVGQLEATSEEGVRAALIGRELDVIEISIEQSKEAKSPSIESEVSNPEEALGDRLSAAESAEVVEPIAQLSAGNLPLAPGLRAAASESTSRRVAQTMRLIASRLERGQLMEEIVSELGAVLPPHVVRLISSAARSGNLGRTLSDIVERNVEVRDMRSALFRGLAYPLLVSGLAAIVLIGIMLFLVPTFRQVYVEFDLSLPELTRNVFWWQQTGVWLLTGGLGVGIVVLLLLRKFVGPTTWSNIVSRIPVIGTFTLWAGMAEWSSIMNVLLCHQVPLPEAIRLAGQGLTNRGLAPFAERCSQEVEQGHSISDSLALNRQFPATATLLIRWGEENGMLSEAFAMSREMSIRRLHRHTLLLQSIITPSLFIIILLGCAVIVGGLMMPLFSLIEGLS